MGQEDKNNVLLVRAVADVVKKELKAEHKDIKDTRLRNTRKLLEDYLKLEAHVQNAPDHAITPDMYKLLFGLDGGKAEISKWQASTAFYMHFIDTTLETYQAMCMAGDYLDRRRWCIIDKMYLQSPRHKASDLAEMYHIDKTRVSRIKDQAIEDLSMMLYGIMALVDDMACE